MSWFRRKNSTPPTPSPQPSAAELEALASERALSERAATWFGALKQKFESLLNQRSAELQRLRLPVPRISGELTYECEGGRVLKLSFPSPLIPPHFIVHSRSDVPPPEWASFTPAVYVITGTQEVIQEAKQTYEQQGIIILRRKYPGVWLNQDPYNMYRTLETHSKDLGKKTFNDVSSLDERYLSLALWFAFGATLDSQTTNFRMPLEQLRDFTADDLRQFERCLSLYNALSFGRQQYSFDAVFGFAGSIYNQPKEFSLFPNNILFSDLPEPVFSPALTALKILPADTIRPNVAREFLDSLRAVTCPVAFELIDDSVAAYFQLICAKADSGHIRHQLELYFPTAAVIEHESAALTRVPCVTARPQAMYAEMRTLSEFPLDPLAQFFSLTSNQTEAQTTALQFSFFPIPNETLTVFAEAFKAQEAADNSRAVTRKTPAWQVTLRAFSSNEQILTQLCTAFFGQFASPQYPWTFSQPQHRSLAERDMSEWAFVSTTELAALAHLPTSTINAPRLEKASMKAKLPPELFTAGEVRIGSSEARGQVKPVVLPDSVRARHLYIVGKSGSGKSTLITNIAVQDIERGEGVCVIDPHGDLVSDLLDYIPERRVKDTIYFNVSDRAHPIGLDMMSAKSEAEIEILTDDLITTFRRLTETWGERMETILRYAFNTLLRTPGATFLDVQKLLTNEGWRSTVVRKLNFPPLTDFWYSQFANMPKDATQPILSRMTKIVLSPTLNAIFGQSENTLNFNDVIRNRKILLINLGGDSRDRNSEQLAVSDEMKKLIGSVVVSQLQLAAMRQASIPEAQRVPCRFFVDEFQNFVSGAFPKILSEARKYKLSLTVAHQYISQLDDATRNAVFGNIGTMIVMPLGQKDAAYLGAELGAYTPEDVANLSPERHEALCRPTTMAADTFLFTTLAPPQVAQSFAHAVINRTRAEYSAQDTEDKVIDPLAPDAEGSPRAKRPMQGTEKVFASTAEKILHYVSVAGYLTTSQIIALCYSHLSETSKRPAASRDLKKLTDAKKLKSINWGDGKVFCASASCNPTAHNVTIRDILIRILQSGFEVAEVNFSASLGALSPDLLVTFLSEDGSLLPTYWEYDTGTEGITEILKKIARYVPYSATSRVAFICTSPVRVQAILKMAQADFIECATLEEFAGLNGPAFISRTRTDKYSFF
jgi:hypothetical protein